MPAVRCTNPLRQNFISINSPSNNTMHGLKPYFIFTFFLVFSLHLAFSTLTCDPKDRQILVYIKRHFGPRDLAFNNWRGNVDCCSWNGVGCNADGRVISLDLRMCLRRGVKHEIPDVIRGLELLKSLKLFVSEGRLIGPIARAVAALYDIEHLDLSGNVLSGSIPGFIGQLESLKYLDLTGNEFSGNITQTLGFLTKLKTLKLGNNHLAGPIPNNFGQIRSLEYLDLSKNKLTGYIPEKLGELPLKYFDVSDNQLEGKIPDGLSGFGWKWFKNNKGLCGLPLCPCHWKMVEGEKEIVKEMLYMIE